jgi:hypothetical protein
MLRFALFLGVLIVAGVPPCSGTEIIDFDQLADSELVTTRFAGLIFASAIVLQSGVTDNEFEFPPVSPPNVISDVGGPISIQFGIPVYSVGAYITHLHQRIPAHHRVREADLILPVTRHCGGKTVRREGNTNRGLTRLHVA